jgi:hypothetical protein
MDDLMIWLEGLKGGAPQVIGAVIGSLLGFIALVVGALFNAKLNRDRDDRLRKVEIRAVAAAIRAELGSLEDSLTDNAKRLIEAPPSQLESFFMPDLTHSVHIFPKMIEKLAHTLTSAAMRTRGRSFLPFGRLISGRVSRVRRGGRGAVKVSDIGCSPKFGQPP